LRTYKYEYNWYILTDGYYVPDCAYNGEKEDGAQMIKEEPIGHEITGIQDDGWEHVEEEGSGRKW